MPANAAASRPSEPAASGRRRLDELPLPSGWFAVATSAELPPRSVRPARFGDEELVLWRAADGTVHLAGAFCPHLGAHLGHLGRVRGGLIECGFHGFCYDASGICRATGYGGRVPPQARLETHPVIETGGVVLGWFDPSARTRPGEGAPSWTIPELDWSGWSAPVWHTATFGGHPLDVTENSIDIGHFSFLHSYDAIEVLTPARAEGPVLRSSYRITRSRPLHGVPMPAMQADFAIEAYGLGCARVELAVRSIGARLRLNFLATPIGGGRIVLRSGVAARRSLDEDAPRALALLPGGLVAGLVRGFTMLNVKADVAQDRPVWQSKAHVRHPVLAEGDGPIGLFRHWAGQFVGERTPSWERSSAAGDGEGRTAAAAGR